MVGILETGNEKSHDAWDAFLAKLLILPADRPSESRAPSDLPQGLHIHIAHHPL